MTMNVKKCGRCHETKSVSQYYKRGDGSGVRSICKDCHLAKSRQWMAAHWKRKALLQKVRRAANRAAERDRARRWREANPEKVREISRRHYERNALQRRADRRTYYRANVHKQRAARCAYGDRNRERETAAKAAWRAANPLKTIAAWQRRTAKKKAATLAPVDFAAILLRDGLICYLCGLPIDGTDLHFDHDIPISRGGAHDEANIHPAHGRCNRKKNDKTAAEYRALLHAKQGDSAAHYLPKPAR